MVGKIRAAVGLFVFALVMGFLLFPLPVQAAEISEVAIQYYQKPVLGKTPVQKFDSTHTDGITVGTGTYDDYPTKCYIDSVKWYMSPSTLLSETDTFLAGKTYYAEIVLKSNKIGESDNYHLFKEKSDLSWLKIYPGSRNTGSSPYTDVINKTKTTVSGDKKTLTVYTNDVLVPNQYILTFDLQGHGTSIPKQAYTPSEKIILPPDPVDDEWYFVGWYHDKAGEHPFYDQIITGDKTIYAHWIKTIDEVKVTGFKKPVMGDNLLKEGDLGIPSGVNYSIQVLNWFKNGSLISGEEKYEAGQKYTLKICLIGKGEYGFAETSKMKSVVLNGSEEEIATYTSGWAGIDIITKEYIPGCVISFDANGGTGSMEKQTADYDASYKLPECSFKAPEGKVFDKWDAGAAGSEVKIKDNIVLKALWKDAGPNDSPYPAKKVSPENPIPLSRIEAAIPTRKNDKDLNCSTFSLLQAKGVPKGETSIKLSWQKVEGATGYIIYGNKCGKKNHYEKLKTTAKTSYKQKKLKKGTYYKYIVVAINGDQALAASKTIHVSTNGGKYSNNTGVTLNKKKLTIKRKKSAKVKATLLRGNLQVKNHRAVAFESSDYRIATVTSKGKIKGVKKGTCYIYAYAQNGMCAKIKVKVKK